MNISPEQAQGLAMVLIQGIEREIPTTTKILAAVPQDKLGFTLGDKGRTAQDLMCGRRCQRRRTVPRRSPHATSLV
jgi:hypothetical protein